MFFYKKNKVFINILLILFIVNIFQALFTQIIADEAYYKYYSENLSWGYYDHPPMVSLMIKISSLLFSGNLSIRFLTIITHLLTILIIWKIIDNRQASKKDIYLFFIIISSVVMFAAYGFITTPDSPLLLFTALLLLSYKRFLKEESLTNMALLSISMVGLIYSKYQGGLVIILLILSNIKLLKNYKFWISGLIALGLYTPHIIWQINNEFPSFIYHTVGRSKPFKLKYILEYLPNQAASFNPFILIVAIYILFKDKSKEALTRSYKFIIIGLIAFFGLSALRGHVEPHWTIAAAIPMVIMIYSWAIKSIQVRKYIRYTVAPSLIIIVLLRIAIVTNWLIPQKVKIFNQKEFAFTIDSLAQGRDVVFMDSYQNPSIFKFYSKSDAISVNSVYYRKNQYDLQDNLLEFYNKDILLITHRGDSLANIKIFNGDTLYYRFCSNLISTSNIYIKHNIKRNQIIDPQKEHLVDIEMINPNNIFIPFFDKNFPITPHIVLIRKGRKYSLPASFKKNQISIGAKSKEKNSLAFTFPENMSNGKYHMVISLKCGPFKEGYNSRPVDIIVQN